MSITLSALAELVGGTLSGSGETEITGAASLAEVAAGQITFVDKREKLAEALASPAAAIVVPRGTGPTDRPTIEVADVYAAFGTLITRFHPPRRRQRSGISPLAQVSPGARIAQDVEIHAGATIGDDVEIGWGSTIHSGARIGAGCRLGEQVTVHPNAVLYDDTVVGPRSMIHAGAVLGADGFGYRFVDGRHKLSAQLGNVVLGAEVEIGANSTVDRGTYGATTIGEGTKIDNQVQIGHNCRIGRHNLICAQVGIAGSTSTGDWVVLAGQVGVRDHVHIGSRAVIAAMAGVKNDIPEGACYMGIPAMPEREQKLLLANLLKLPELRRQFKELQRQVDQLVPEPQAQDSTEGTAAGGRHAA